MSCVAFPVLIYSNVKSQLVNTKYSIDRSWLDHYMLWFHQLAHIPMFIYLFLSL